MKKQFRCTRNKPYPPGCVGFANPKARQGHYVWATSRFDAWQQMVALYPQEINFGFTVEEWSSK